MKKIRLSKASISETEKNSVLKTLDDEFLGMGTQVGLFEKKIKEFITTDMEVVCVSSGTSALHLAIAGLEIGLGDEVLVPSLTYVGSFQAISATGATPVPCEVNPKTLFIDTEDAKKKITKKTKAIMPVHYASSSKGMDKVYKLAKENNLRIVEDAAQAFGCRRSGKNIGFEGDVICFSFDGIKNITCGEGGAILSNDKNFINKVKDNRLLGVQKDSEKRLLGLRSWDFDVVSQGWRYHMSNIMAAIGLAQLDRIEEFRSSRLKIVNEYIEALAGIKNVKVLNLDFSELISHIFVIKVDKRDDLREYLTSFGIECGLHYKPNHLLTKFSKKESLPVTEKLYKKILTLPCHNDLTKDEQMFVIKKIKSFYGF
jgi:dTDP-4-amino-4,6-dideoxygalactose transaminase